MNPLALRQLRVDGWAPSFTGLLSVTEADGLARFFLDGGELGRPAPLGPELQRTLTATWRGKNPGGLHMVLIDPSPRWSAQDLVSICVMAEQWFPAVVCVLGPTGEGAQAP